MALLATALIAAVGAAVLPAIADAAPAPGVRASYANPVRSGGRVDAAATVARLRALNANTYAFLVHNENDWNDFEPFLREAQAADLTVWAYLVPPSECPGGEDTCAQYLPHKKNYVAWAQAVGALAKKYPVLRALAMDDFYYNRSFFTPAYTAQVRAAAGIDFYPVVYGNQLTADFVTRYGSTMDSLILPFNDAPNRNTLWTGSLRGQLDRAIALLAEKNRKLILMVYASTLSNTTVTPDVGYVRAVTAVGVEYTKAGRIAGVIQYALPLTPDVPQNKDVSFAHTGRGGLVFTVHGNTTTQAGDFAAASTTIRLDEGSTSCSMVLWHSDDWEPATAGYHMKQALVAGTRVWQRDVASEGTDWYTSAPKDLTPYLTGGSATLTLRLYEAKGVGNYRVVARFDDVLLTGCHIANADFETTGGWTFTRGNGPVNGGIHISDPVYSSSVHAAVAALYAS
ncbi:hypothetical protein [Saccharothrix coeruleofusca]|uniref:Glycosyl hydrolase-like family 15 (GHL15) protein n=1 Tax=Saccharothrix coeruleofusca TaxID=33919 RepID=A0A918EEE5_9PSEU|nr:hypothetical protein [Saccharothrix coeruleofusca]MBP2336574.1 hypothetical protein [Saccharothrix coeruleofusca]GGP52041.1 hypothetical protein GCM10010185_25130 [Saccharothrix coeruleofusca]